MKAMKHKVNGNQLKKKREEHNVEAKRASKPPPELPPMTPELPTLPSHSAKSSACGDISARKVRNVGWMRTHAGRWMKTNPPQKQVRAILI